MLDFYRLHIPRLTLLLKSALQTCQHQKFFIRLNTLCQKLTVPKQGIGRDRRRHILCAFFISDMDGLERDTISPCALFWFTNALQMWYTLMGH